MLNTFINTFFKLQLLFSPMKSTYNISQDFLHQNSQKEQSLYTKQAVFVTVSLVSSVLIG